MLNGECWRLLIRQRRLFFFVVVFLSFNYSVIRLTFLLQGFRPYSPTCRAEPQRSALKENKKRKLWLHERLHEAADWKNGRLQRVQPSLYTSPQICPIQRLPHFFFFFLFIFLCLFLAPPSHPHSQKISEHLAESLKISFPHDFTH